MDSEDIACDPSFGHFQIVLYHEPAEIRKEFLSSAVNYTDRPVYAALFSPVGFVSFARCF